MMIKNLALALLFIFLCSLPGRCELSLALSYLNQDEKGNIHNQLADHAAIWDTIKDRFNNGNDTLKQFLRKISETVKSFLAKKTPEENFIESLHISENGQLVDP